MIVNIRRFSLLRACKGKRDTSKHTADRGVRCMARNSIELMGTPDGLFYWIPGELVVVARLQRHPAAETQDMLVEQIRGQLNALLLGYGITLEAYGTAGRWRDASTGAGA